MIHHLQGDLLKSDCTFIGHQANCHSRMGSGIARQIAADLPEMARVDRNPTPPKDKLGNLTYTRIPNGWGFNLYGQFNYGAGTLQTNYKALERAIDKMLTIIPELARFDTRKLPVKVGFPYLMGCGLAGGDWAVVYEILDRLSVKHGIDIYLYEFTP